ncbi:MAG: response regulator transcription factor [Candidatus Nanopelagicales bacterium]
MTRTEDTEQPQSYLRAAEGVPPVRVLVVDDEPDLADLVSTALRFDGCRTMTAGDADEAVRIARDFRPDIAVLDVMLPGDDGVRLLARLRADHPDLPAVFLTARGETRDRIAGLRAGADDYIAKPFSLEELLARLQAVLRRTGRLDERGAVLRVADLTLDELTREVHRAGELVDLTPTEFDLLRFLMQNARTVVSKAQILDRVWHYDFAGRSNIVEQYVGYLRRKVDADHEPLIHTVRGVGYVLRPPRSADSGG